MAHFGSHRHEASNIMPTVSCSSPYRTASDLPYTLPYLGFVGGQFGVETAMLATEILYAGQITTVIVGREEKLLLPEDGRTVTVTADEYGTS